MYLGDGDWGLSKGFMGFWIGLEGFLRVLKYRNWFLEYFGRDLYDYWIKKTLLWILCLEDSKESINPGDINIKVTDLDDASLGIS